MNRLLFLLAISATLVTQSIIAKANTKNMTFLREYYLGDNRGPFQSPWIKDPNVGKCNANEWLSVVQTKTGAKMGSCMPISKDGKTCPSAPANTRAKAEISKLNENANVCILKCSENHQCPSGAQCHITPGNSGICYYQKPAALSTSTTQYDGPWARNKNLAQCNSDKEKFFDSTGILFNRITNHLVREGTVLGMCDPIYKDFGDSCPKPSDDVAAKPFKTTNNSGYCILSCTADIQCSSGSLCYFLDFFLNGWCWYQKPGTPKNTFYGYPWQIDEFAGSCYDELEEVVSFQIKQDGKLGDHQVHKGTVLGGCMPVTTNLQPCPDPTENVAAKAEEILEISGKKYCALKCTKDNECLANQLCYTGVIGNTGGYCLYQKPGTPPPQPSPPTPTTWYNGPWAQNKNLAQCNPDKEFLWIVHNSVYCNTITNHLMRDGTNLGLCKPIASEFGGSCPLPPLNVDAKANIYGGYCYLNCETDKQCPLGSLCYKAPGFPNQCWYQQPGTPRNSFYRCPSWTDKTDGKCYDGLEEVISFQVKQDGKLGGHQVHKGIVLGGCMPVRTNSQSCPDPTENISAKAEEVEISGNKYCALKCTKDSECLENQLCYTGVFGTTGGFCLYQKPGTQPKPDNDLMKYVIIGAAVVCFIALLVFLACIIKKCRKQKPGNDQKVGNKSQNTDNDNTRPFINHTVEPNSDNKKLYSPFTSFPPIIPNRPHSNKMNGAPNQLNTPNDPINQSESTTTKNTSQKSNKTPVEGENQVADIGAYSISSEDMDGYDANNASPYYQNEQPSKCTIEPAPAKNKPIVIVATNPNTDLQQNDRFSIVERVNLNDLNQIIKNKMSQNHDIRYSKLSRN